jgi:hypothetical protein
MFRATRGDMLIRSTPHACFVMLRNGLTLELFYDEALSGVHTGGESTQRPADLPPPSMPTGSQGVWLFGESVLFEVSAGQA